MSDAKDPADARVERGEMTVASGKAEVKRFKLARTQHVQWVSFSLVLVSLWLPSDADGVVSSRVAGVQNAGLRHRLRCSLCSR